MGFVVIVPARMSSSRLKEKPLADICGKPMVVRTAERALGALHFRLLLIKMKRPLADGADQNFGKAAVHNIVVSIFG